MVKRMLLGLFWGLLVCGLITLLVGCGTKYVAVPEVHWRDSVVLRLQRDSVFTHDSVWVNTYLKGDTVFVDKVKTTYLYKDRLRIDTLLVSRRDSVPYIVEKKSVEYKYRQRWYERVACKIGYGVILFLVTALAVWIYRKAKR